MEKSILKRTPVYDEHVRLGGHMVDFAGWEMPLHYGSIIEEHMAVREKAGLFDVSHMGELLFTGKNSLSGLDRLSTNGLLDTGVGACTYTHHLNPEGMIIDDTIATRTSDEEFLTVPNASKIEEVSSWVRSHSVDFVDVSDETCCFSVQGPKAEKILERIHPDSVKLKSFNGAFTGRSEGSLQKRLAGGELFISRTGYTGEDGFEIFAHKNTGPQLWRKILEEGADFGIRPIGLGARDSLRLEKCYLLSGTDFDGHQTTLETGYSWIVDWDHEFIGRNALEKQRTSVDYPKLASFIIEGRLIPRHGDGIVLPASNGKGYVTSGGFSPVLGRAIAMGYVSPWAKAADHASFTVRGREVSGTAVKPPFVKRK